MLTLQYYFDIDFAENIEVTLQKEVTDTTTKSDEQKTTDKDATDNAMESTVMPSQENTDSESEKLDAEDKETNVETLSIKEPMSLVPVIVKFNGTELPGDNRLTVEKSETYTKYTLHYNSKESNTTTSDWIVFSVPTGKFHSSF